MAKVKKRKVRNNNSGNLDYKYPVYHCPKTPEEVNWNDPEPSRVVRAVRAQYQPSEGFLKGLRMSYESYILTKAFEVLSSEKGGI